METTVCKLEQNGVKFINTLKGHSGSIQCLAWDGVKNWLYSGSYDASVFVWDIGGRRGTVYELHGHRSKVTSLVYSPTHSRLVSAGEDRRLVSSQEPGRVIYRGCWCWQEDRRPRGVAGG